MTARLAWVTAQRARGRDEDEAHALAGFRRAGVDVDIVAWDDPAVSWAAYDRAVLRSTWDYVERLDEFLAWLGVAERQTDVRNPPAMVRWNLDKRYLAELGRTGVPTTDTVFVAPDEPAAFPAGEFVVKPAVGAGSRDAASYGPDQHDAATAHVTRLHAAGTDVLVQPLLRSVAADGEWDLVFLGGRYSHAANKRVALPRAGLVDDLFAAETLAQHDADPDQMAVAQQAVDVVAQRFGVPLYARVDLVRDDHGDPCVLELELVEPSLFLPQAPSEAIDRLVTVFANE